MPNLGALFNKEQAHTVKVANVGFLEFRRAFNSLRQRTILLVMEKGTLARGDVTRLRAELGALTDNFGGRLQEILTENQRRLFLRGIKLVDNLLAGQGLKASVPYLSEQLLDQMRGYNADLVQGLTDGVRRRVASELDLAVMGQKRPEDVVRDIGRSLGDQGSIFGSAAARASIIYKTETQRLHNMAAAQRLLQISAVTAGGLEKEWMHSHATAPRPGHFALDGKRVKAEQRFELMGQDGRIYNPLAPHDPSLPAFEVVNCKCTVVPIWDRSKVVFPGPRPVPPPIAVVKPPPPPKPPRKPRAASVTPKADLTKMDKPQLAEHLKKKTGIDIASMARDKDMNEKDLRDIVRTLEELNRDFDHSLGFVRYMPTPKKDTYAHCQLHGNMAQKRMAIEFNREYAASDVNTRKRFDFAYARDIRSGFHPGKSPKNSTLKTMLTHEFGHSIVARGTIAVDRNYSDHRNKTTGEPAPAPPWDRMNQALMELLAESKAMGRKGVSGYANGKGYYMPNGKMDPHDWTELVAESLADVYCNVPKDAYPVEGVHPISKKVVAVLKRYRGKGRSPVVPKDTDTWAEMLRKAKP